MSTARQARFAACRVPPSTARRSNRWSGSWRLSAIRWPAPPPSPIPGAADVQRVACVIPAYDAAHTLASVIRGLRAAVPDAVTIVVDDGSRDGTEAVAERWADVAVHLAHNRGKGAALRAGFAMALGTGATAILTIDADGQHDPACAPRLLAALHDADVVIGARE